MRKFVVLAAAAASLFAFVAIAQAFTQTMKIKVSPNRAGTATNPKATGVDVDLALVGANPKPANKTIVYFDKNIVLNSAKFPACTLAKATSNTCPANTKVGTGAAEALVGGSTLKFTITLFNSKAGHGLILALRGPLPINLEGTWTKATGLYGQKLTVNIPASARHPAPGVDTPLTKFSTHLPVRLIRKSGKTYSYTALKGCGAGSKLRFKATFTYDGAPAQNPTATAACRK
jgi:hypothetical protein